MVAALCAVLVLTTATRDTQGECQDECAQRQRQLPYCPGEYKNERWSCEVSCYKQGYPNADAGRWVIFLVLRFVLSIDHVLMDERKLAMEEAHRAMEVERQLMFMDTSNMDEKQKAYVKMCRDEVLRKKQMLAWEEKQRHMLRWEEPWEVE
ncbi:hypothetical protein D1007_07668 [Hordeum vulgare]|nr:hypothetical protein D1007_07668 [Hordeum vulgare]